MGLKCIMYIGYFCRSKLLLKSIFMYKSNYKNFFRKSYVLFKKGTPYMKNHQLF